MKEAILIVAEGCHYCEELMKALPKDKVRVLDVTKSLEAARLMRDLGVYKVPLLITVEKTEQGTEVCALEEKEGKVKCVKSEASSEEPS